MTSKWQGTYIILKARKLARTQAAFSEILTTALHTDCSHQGQDSEDDVVITQERRPWRGSKGSVVAQPAGGGLGSSAGPCPTHYSVLGEYRS
jgi:hypothetical protein